MTDRSTPLPDPAPDRAAPTRPFDADTGYSGQDYRRASEEAEGRGHPSGHPLTGDPAINAPVGADDARRDIPRDNGKRGWVDPATGEVHGSGAGAGGGNPGEDLDTATPGSS